MIKSTTEAVGTGVNRTVSERKTKAKPITALFPGGSFSTFGKPLGEMKVVKKTFWGLLGSYTRYVKEFVPYEEDDFIDNKVLNGGGGSGVPIPLPDPPSPPEPPYVVPPVQNLKVDSVSINSITISWDEYPNDPENDTVGFKSYINGIEQKILRDTTFYDAVQLNSDTEYVLGIQAIVLHNGVETSSIVVDIDAKTLAPEPVVPVDPANVVVSNPTVDTLTITWDEPDITPDSYLFYLDDTLVFTMTPASSLTYTFTGLQSGTSYSLGIQAQIGIQTSNIVIEVGETSGPPPEPVVPEDPANLMAVGSLYTILITWDAPTTVPDAYLFYLDDSLLVTVSPVLIYEYTFAGLTPDTSYKVGVQAKIGSETSNIVSTTLSTNTVV